MVTLTSELEVLIATSHWLRANDWSIESLSPAFGSGLPSAAQQIQTIRRELEDPNIPLARAHSSDIEAQTLSRNPKRASGN